jgi:hypothetical protein
MKTSRIRMQQKKKKFNIQCRVFLQRLDGLLVEFGPYRVDKINFFSLIIFGGTEVPIVYIFLCSPSEDSLQQSAIPDGSPSQDSSPL